MCVKINLKDRQEEKRMYKSRVIRAVSVKLYPNNKQKDKIEFFINGNRWVWNYFIEFQQKLKLEGKSFMSAFSMDYIFCKLRQQKEYLWLKDLHMHSVKGTLKKLEIAYRNFFRRNKNGEPGGYPKFKSKKHSASSFVYPDNNKIKGNKILLGKIGYIKARGIRHFPNMKILQLVIKKISKDNYMAMYTIECDNCSEVATGKIKSIGIDVGINKFLTDSNGNKIKPINYKKEINKIKLLQQQMERNDISKIRKEKIRLLISKLYRKIANKRTNWLHHVANQYLKYRNVYVEDLNIKQMTKNISGTIENPNINSRLKSNLNNIILQQGWGTFFNILKYKIEDRKGIFYRVNPMFTSQQCSKCNFVDKLSRSGEYFKCTKCGHEIDADYNAAINILNKGYPDLHLANKA